MTAHEALQALDDAIAGAEPTDRPALIIGLAARLAALGASIATAQPAQSVDPAPPGAGDFNLKPEQAAAIAGINVGQIYTWSRGQRGHRARRNAASASPRLASGAGLRPRRVDMIRQYGYLSTRGYQMEKGVKTTVLLPEALWARVKKRAVDDRSDLRTIVIAALEAHLKAPRGTR